MKEHMKAGLLKLTAMHFASRLFSVFLLVSMQAQASLYTPQAYFKHGAVYARDIVRDSDGNPIYVEYDINGSEVLGGLNVVDTPDEEYRVLSGIYYRSVIEQYHSVVTAYQQSGTDAPVLVDRETYLAGGYTTVAGQPISVNPYALRRDTVMVLLAPPSMRYSTDPSRLLLQQFDIDPSYSVADDANSLLLRLDMQQPGDIVTSATVVAESANNIGYRVGFFGEGTTVSDSATRRYDDDIYGPLSGVPVLMDMPYAGGAVTDEQGKYRMQYYLPPCPGFTFDFSTPVTVELYYKRFNPQSGPTMPYYLRRQDWDYCNGLAAYPPGYTLLGLMTQISIAGIIATSATPAEPNIDFPLDIMVLSGRAALTNGAAPLPLGTTHYDGERSALERIAQQYDDLDADGAWDLALLGDWIEVEGGDTVFSTNVDNPTLQGVWLSRRHGVLSAPPDGVPPDLTRPADWSADFADRALLSEIDEHDLKNTDLYVFRESDGSLIMERVGLSDTDPLLGVDSGQGKFFYTLRLVGSRGRLHHLYRSLGYDEEFRQWQVDAGIVDESPLYNRIADHLRPGENVHLIAINRATGYLGSLTVPLQAAGNGSTDLEISFDIDDIRLLPPNLKVWAERRTRTELGLTQGEINEYWIGNEGAALSDDELIVLYTEWLDPQGYPLPSELDDYGYTARLAKVSGIGSSATLEEVGFVENFPIKTGRRMQLVQLPSGPMGNQHYYVQISGEPSSRNPDFSSSGVNGGVLTHRADRFAPVLTPVFDEVSTNLSVQAWNFVRQSNSDAEEPAPIYRWRYRPEYQFSVYDLDMWEINRQDVTGQTQNLLEIEYPVIGVTDSAITLLYSLTGPSSDGVPLDTLDAYSYEGSKELVFAFGEQEVTATLDENGSVNIDDATLLAKMTPEDYVSIRLYANNDTANVLWEWAAQKKLFEGVTKNLFVKQDIDILNNRSCFIGSVFQFYLMRPATVSLEFEPFGTSGGSDLILLDNVPMQAGYYAFPVDSDALQTGEYTSTLTGVEASSGYTEEETGAALSELTTQDRLPVGHAIVKGVDLYDGHLSHSRQEFSVAGRGKSLDFTRSYGSNADGKPGVLGVGWNHNWDTRIVNYCGEYMVIGAEGGGIRFVEDVEGNLLPLKGYHGTLLRDNGDFDFYPKGGNRYHYVKESGETSWHLAYVTDTNGNTTSVSYEKHYGQRYISEVSDSTGRVMGFEYTERAFPASHFAGTFTVLSRLTGPGGLSVAFDYDEFGNLISADRGEGARIEQYGYNTEDSDTLLQTRHKLIRYTDPNGGQTDYTYNEKTVTVQPEGGAVIELPYRSVMAISEPTGISTGFSYSTELPSSETVVIDPNGNATTYALNHYGSAVGITDPVGTTEMSWSDSDVVMLSRTDANGVLTEYTYDEHANVLSETTGDYTRSYTYATIPDKPWIKNRKASETDRNGNTTNYRYDGNGNLIEVEDARGGTTVHDYNGLGDRISTRDANSHTTTFAYDSYGNLASVTDPQGYVTSATWDERSRKLTGTDANGGTTHFIYDALDNLIERTDALAESRSSTYDAMGHPLTETDELGRTTTWVYDGLGRLVSETNAAGDTRSFSYDGNGNKLSESDWLGNLTGYAYDGGNRLTTRTEPLGRITTYGYDAVGNLTAETDANHHTTTHSYDVLNRKLSTTDALNGTVSLVYDGENLLSQTDALGRTTSYGYDELNRRTQVSDALDGVTTTVYDAVGNVLSVTDANSHTRSFGYDAANRKVSQTDAEAHTTHYSYDGNANLLTMTDAREHVTQYAYDALNRKIETTDAGGAVTTYSYDAVGNPLSEAWANGNTLSHSYDALNRLTESHDTLGTLATYTYDANGNKLTETDANGRTTSFTYDALNRLTQTTLPTQHTLGYGYDTLGNKTSELDANGHTTTYTYDALNRLTQVTDPLSQTLGYTYDAVGNKRSETDKRSHTTTYDYDVLNRLTQVTDPLGQTLAYTYDAVGNKLSETDKRSHATVYTYDNENRLLTTTKAGLLLDTVTYDAVGNVQTRTDANNHTVSFSYDVRNRLKSTTSALGLVTIHAYDAMGDRLSTTDPDSHTTGWSYDMRRRTLSETNPASETTSYSYDGNGNRTQMTRPGGNSRQYGYDALNRLVSITDPLSGVTTYSLDGNGNRLSQQDANGNTTGFDYDALNRKVTTHYADGATESYGYDANGNLTALTDAKAQLISYTYDALNRRSQADYPAGGEADALISIVTTYDANGNPTGHTEHYAGDNERTTTKVYDDFDRLTQVTDGFGRVIGYGYDNNGNRTGLTDPDSVETSYSFDADNRLTQVTTVAGITSYSYDGVGRITQISHPNGTLTQQSYNPAGRLSTIRHGLADAMASATDEALLAAYHYSYDANGNRLTQTETQSGITEQSAYSYDSADRLIEVTYPDKRLSYSYDANYNRLSELTTATDGTVIASLSYAYNSRNQLEDITGELDAAQSVHYQYDANGNQTVKSKNGVVTTFIYDARDKLISVQEAQTTLGRFRYDYRGMRIEKQGADGLLRYSYDGDSVLTQADESGNTVAKYEYGPDRLLSLNNTGEGRRYYHHDALGSVIALSDSSGQSGAAYRYDAWGKARETSGQSNNPFGFTGHEKDEETGLYYFKARFYDPDTGRFLSQDSYLGEGMTPPSLHRYLYAYSNPTKYTDPSGHCIWDLCIGEIAVVAALAGVITWEGSVIHEEVTQGSSFTEAASNTTHLKRGAAVSGVVLSGGTLGLPATGVLVTTGGAMDVAHQTAVEGKSFDQVDWESAALSGGYTAGGGGILGPMALSTNLAARTTATVTIGGLSTAGAVDGGSNIVEGFDTGNYGQVSYGIAETALSAVGFKASYDIAPSASSKPTIVTEATTKSGVVAEEPAPQGVGGVPDNLAAKVSFDPSVNIVDRSLGVRAGEAIADNPVASASYARLQRQGTDVHFVGDTSMPEMAVFDGNRNTVTINLARHSSPEDIASTLVHEATHQNRFFSGNQLGTQFEEYLSLRNEFLYGAGRRPSLPERQIIWQKTQELYPELPAGRTPFGGAQ